jgi:hypothetical protein
VRACSDSSVAMITLSKGPVPPLCDALQSPDPVIPLDVLKITYFDYRRPLVLDLFTVSDYLPIHGQVLLSLATFAGSAFG